MYKELESKFNKTVKLTKILTYVFLFFSIVIGIYLIVTMSTSSKLFEISQGDSGYLLSFDRNYAVNLMVGEFVNTYSKSKIKLVYSYIILNALIIVIFIDLIMYNILKFFRYSSSKETPFCKDVIKYLDIIKRLMVALAILPNIIKCTFRYILTRHEIVIFDNLGFLIPIFIALILNVMKYIFLYGIKLQEEYDSML